MEKIKFRNKEFDVVEIFLNKKIHVKYKNRDFVIVPFNTIEDYETYLKHKKVLKKCKIEMPKIIKKDRAKLLLLEQYIEGENLLNIIAANRLDNKMYEELFRIYRNNRFAKILLNYKPENFVKHRKYFYYTSSEVTTIDRGIAFERSDDILLWMNTENQKRYIESKKLIYVDRNLYTNQGEIKKQIALLCVSYW